MGCCPYISNKGVLALRVRPRGCCFCFRETAAGIGYLTLSYQITKRKKNQPHLQASYIFVLARCNLYPCSQPRHSQKHSPADAAPLQGWQPSHFPLAISEVEQYCNSLMQPKGHLQRGPSGISVGREASSSEKTL